MFYKGFLDGVLRFFRGRFCADSSPPKGAARIRFWSAEEDHERQRQNILTLYTGPAVDGINPALP